MTEKSITAMVSCFSRAYHAENYEKGVFKDYLARKMFSEEEYKNLALHMSKGINFFNPEFKGDNEQALRWIVDNYLSPSPIGRSVFCENALENAVLIGAKQYIIFGSGYDTFAYRKSEISKKIKIFEVDRQEVVKDKKERLKRANIQEPDNICYISADLSKDKWIENLTLSKDFNKHQITFCSMLGLSYYLSENSFKNILLRLSNELPKGSSIVFDYPDENTYTDKAGIRTKKQLMLAQGANEEMKASYSYSKLQKMLCDCNMLIYEHLTPDQITKNIFGKYNNLNKDNKITGFDNVNYCLAVKK